MGREGSPVCQRVQREQRPRGRNQPVPSQQLCVIVTRPGSLERRLPGRPGREHGLYPEALESQRRDTSWPDLSSRRILEVTENRMTGGENRSGENKGGWYRAS